MTELSVEFELEPRNEIEAEFNLEQREEVNATFELNVTKVGPQGPEGPRGPEGKPGKDATVNGKNTVTITTSYGISINQTGETLNISGKEITDVVDGISAVIPAGASEQDKLALSSDIPTNNDQLENGAGYVTKQYVDDIVGDIETLLNNINSGS